MSLLALPTDGLSALQRQNAGDGKNVPTSSLRVDAGSAGPNGPKRPRIFGALWEKIRGPIVGLLSRLGGTKAQEEAAIPAERDDAGAVAVEEPAVKIDFPRSADAEETPEEPLPTITVNTVNRAASGLDLQMTQDGVPGDDHHKPLRTVDVTIGFGDSPDGTETAPDRQVPLAMQETSDAMRTHLANQLQVTLIRGMSPLERDRAILQELFDRNASAIYGRPNFRNWLETACAAPLSGESGSEYLADLRRAIVDITDMNYGCRIPGEYLADQILHGTVLEEGGRLLLHPLGNGGMGVVYLACDKEGGGPVVVKMSPNPQFQKRLIVERQILELLQQRGIPGFARLVLMGQSERSFTQEFIDGHTLTALSEANGGALPSELIVDCVHDLADSLGQAHDAGVAHLDVKPDNVLIDLHGQSKLVDTGIASSMNTGEMSIASLRDTKNGTPGYMCPELTSEQNDGAGQNCNFAKRDVYALGVTLFTSLGGRLELNEGECFCSIDWSQLHGVPEEILALGRQMTGRAAERPTMSQVVKTLEAYRAKGWRGKEHAATRGTPIITPKISKNPYIRTFQTATAQMGAWQQARQSPKEYLHVDPLPAQNAAGPVKYTAQSTRRKMLWALAGAGGALAASLLGVALSPRSEAPSDHIPATGAATAKDFGKDRVTGVNTNVKNWSFDIEHTLHIPFGNGEQSIPAKRRMDVEATSAAGQNEKLAYYGAICFDESPPGTTTAFTGPSLTVFASPQQPNNLLFCMPGWAFVVEDNHTTAYALESGASSSPFLGIPFGGGKKELAANAIAMQILQGVTQAPPLTYRGHEGLPTDKLPLRFSPSEVIDRDHLRATARAYFGVLQKALGPENQSVAAR